MKNAIPTLILALWSLLFAQTSAFGQLYEVSLDEKIEQSTLIVEGKVIESQCYRADNGDIYTANKIELASILKGDYREKFLTITTWGGEIDGKSQTWTHLLTLDKSDYGIFCLEPSRVPFIADDHFPPSFDVYAGVQGFLAFTHNEAKAWIAYEPFHTYTDIEADLYQYIARKTGEAQTLVNPATASAIKSGVRYHFTDINLSGNVITFKVYVNSLVGSKSLYRSGLQFSYNPTFFGANLATNGNLVMSGAGISASSTYGLSQSNVTSNKVKIELTPAGSLSGLTTIGATEQLLAEGKLIIQNIAADPGITYNLAEMQSMSKFYKNGLPYVFDTVVVDGEWKMFDDYFIPKIDSITPKLVAAEVNGMALNGIPGKITIFGSNFGDPLSGYIKPHLSDVLFYDVDGGFFPAGELEYISWSNTKIEVEVPTMQKTGGTSSLGACTGKVGVFTTNFTTGDTATVYSSDILHVQFGIYNNPWNITINNWQTSPGNTSNVTIYGGQRQNLVDVNGMGGYTAVILPIYVDPISNQAAVGQIIKALDVYRCGYKINVKLSPTSAGVSSAIRRANIPIGTSIVTMIGNSNVESCSNSTDSDAYVLSFDVRINRDLLDTLTVGGVTYMFNISDNIPADTATIYYIDFQRTLLHELGHVFQLRHTNNPGDIMTSGPASLPLYNNFARSLSANDILGLQHIYLLSQLGACDKTKMTDYVCTNGVESVQPMQLPLLVFPNPATNKLFLKVSILGVHKIKVFAVDGREVFNESRNFDHDITEIPLPAIMSSGLYWISIFDENANRLISQKFIVEK